MDTASPGTGRHSRSKTVEHIFRIKSELIAKLLNKIKVTTRSQ
jgi:hypothetical protein